MGQGKTLLVFRREFLLHCLLHRWQLHTREGILLVPHQCRSQLVAKRLQLVAGLVQLVARMVQQQLVAWLVLLELVARLVPLVARLGNRTKSSWCSGP